MRCRGFWRSVKPAPRLLAAMTQGRSSVRADADVDGERVGGDPDSQLGITSWGVRRDSFPGRYIEFAHRDIRHAGFCRAPNFQGNDICEVKAAGENLVQIEAVHAYDALAASECVQSVCGESALADDETARPARLFLDLAIEGMKGCHIDLSVPPSGFEQIGLIAEHKTAVDLFAPETKGGARRHPVGVEYVLQERLEGIAAGLRVHGGDLEQTDGEGGGCGRINMPFLARCGGRLRFGRPAPEALDDPEVGGAHRVFEFWIVRGDAARIAVFP